MKKRMCICLAFLLLFCGGMMAAGAKDENILQGIVAEYVNNTNPPGGSANVPVDVLTNGEYNFTDGGSGPYGQLWGEVLQDENGSGLCDVELTFDLGEKKCFNRYKIWSHAEWMAVDYNTATNRSYAVKDWSVSVSDDKSSWTEIDKQEGNNEIVFEKTLSEAASGRYIKFHITRCSAKLDGFEGSYWPALRLGEIQVYQAQAAPPVTTTTAADETTTTGGDETTTAAAPDGTTTAARNTTAATAAATATGAEKQESGGFPVAAIVAIVVVIVLAGGGAAGYFLYKKKKSS